MDDRTLTKLVCAELGRLPTWEWRDEGDETPVPVGAVMIFYGAIDSSPDKAVGVRVYGVTDIDLEHLRWRRVQLRVRGERGRPDGADVLADQAFLILQELSRVGGISGISRQSMAPSGADENRREERTDNYTIILDNREAHQ